MRRSPTGIATLDAPRLACVKPIASVHPEPGSNSPLLKLFFILSRSESKYILFLYFRILTVLFSCTTSCFTCKSYKDRFLFLCTPRTLSKNNTLSFFYPITEPVTGCKDKNKFLFEPNLFESFFWKEVFFLIKPICLKQIKKRTPPQKNLSSIFLQQALLSKAGAKVRNISFPYKYFMTFF